VRADKRAITWSSRRDKFAAEQVDEVPSTDVVDDVPVVEQSSAQIPWSAEQYPALDLMANWTNDRPSMSQIMDGLTNREATDVHRQSGGEVNMEV
jgi:hypothetical protein